jgi:hypothetical protein
MSRTTLNLITMQVLIFSVDKSHIAYVDEGPRVVAGYAEHRQVGGES